MAKKQKRQVARTSEAQAAVREPVEVKSSTARSFQTQEFNPDYGYVRKDLKTIGILAASFLTVLVVLSFFLQ